MDIITYALCKKIASGAVSGVDSMSVSGQTLTIACKDGTVLTMTFPTPADGVSITGVEIDSNNHLVVTLSDSNTIDAGLIKTIKGDPGEKGDDGVSVTAVEQVSGEAQIIVKFSDGTESDPIDIPTIQGPKGDDGETPTVEVGTTETIDWDEPAEVEEETTPTGIKLNFKIPKGKPGEGGGGGTGDYDDLTGKPKIEGHTLQSGNNTAASLGIADKATVDDHESRITELEENPVNPFQFTTMPAASDHPQEVIEYIGADTADYKRGYFYRSTPTVISGELTYVWQQQDVQPSNSNYEDMNNKPEINGVELLGNKTSEDFELQSQIQYDELPTAASGNLGKIYQYTGATTADYKKGYWYQCRYDSGTGTYYWVQTDVSNNTELAARVTTLETNQGNMSSLEVTGVTDLVSAINKVNAKAGITRYEYVEPNLIIYYNDGSTFQIAVSSILNETQIGELANVIDTTIQDGNILQYDAALKQYKPYAILAALQQLLADAKDYTDQEISSAIVAGAYVCDEKPSYDAEHDTVIYKQGGVVKTTTQTDARFYYYADGDPYCTSWIDDIEFTFSVSQVDFSEYVNKNTDVVSTYTEGMLDKTKIPDVAALDALLAIVKTALALKVNTSDIVDNLTSSDATKPLSAKQGKVLKDEVDLKQDKVQYSTMPVAAVEYLGMAVQYVGATGQAYTKGLWYECKYDNDSSTYYWDAVKTPAQLGTLQDGEGKPVSGDEIYDALALKQDKILSAPVESETTVEGALGALSDNKQPKTLTSSIEGETTVEGALQALSDKSVDVDGTTIIKDASTGELKAITATQNAVGVVKGGSGTEIGSNGEVNVIDRLEEKSSLPTATAGNLGKCYLLTTEQSGYFKGGIYQCQTVQGSSPAAYEWVLITLSGTAASTSYDNTDSGLDATNVQDAVDEVEGTIRGVLIVDNAAAHNRIYRGKAIGSSVTADQYASISNGTFKDMYIGDYWTIGGVNWRIAAFDYWLHCGDTECTAHHVVIVPDTNLYTAAMNSSNVTTGGYTGSAMCTTNLANAKTTINNAFGSAHILNHRELFTNSVASDGKANNWAWKDSTVDLMNECMVYSHNAWGSHHGYETGIDKSQLPLFAMSPDRITNRAGWWLRDVVSSANFAIVHYAGNAGATGASNA